MRERRYEDVYNYKWTNLYEDNHGVLLTEDDLDKLSVWEIEERGIHVSEL